MSNGLMMLLLWAFCASVAATPTTRRSAQLQEDVQLLHPQVITIERLEHLLRRAGEIFGPASVQPEDAIPSGSEVEPQVELQSQPHQYMLPPTDQPYNFYLPLYDYVDPKLDAKSRHLEKFAPPPQALKQEHNYYADKPKKTPKKFNSSAKHVNLKWLNTYEKAVGGTAPKAIYLEQDERNRINFNDQFFAVDMQIKGSQAEPVDDLMAAPDQMTYNYKPAVGAVRV